MKKISILIVLTLIAAICPIFADDYSIGNSDQPVIEEELYAFLCDSKAIQAEPSVEKLKEDFLGSENNAITCEGTPCNYHFSVNPWQWNMRVSTVPSAYAQQLFDQWRQNPTVQELCYYLNDGMRQKQKLGPGAGWLSLKYKYPQSVTIPQADKVVNSYPLYGRGNNWSTFSFVNEAGKSVFSFSPVTYLLTLKDKCDQYYNNNARDHHDYFHRPVLIELDGQAIFQ